MKERDILEKIRQFVTEFDRRTQSAVRKVVMPAALGMGLALAPGCGPDEDPDRGRPQATQKADLPDGGGIVALYAAPFPGPDAGVPQPQPEYAAPFPSQDSCVGHCNGQAPAGCWCDDQCANYGDCCDDKAAACDDGGVVALYAAPFPADAGAPQQDDGGAVALYAAPFPADTCVSGSKSYCGEQAPAGCWCDDTCATYGDCCDDKAGCEITALYAAPFPE